MGKATTNGRLSKNVESLLPNGGYSANSNSSDMASIITMMERLLHWAAVIESSDDAVISKSVDGYITGWNAAAERLYGYTAEEVIGQPVSMLMPPEKADDFPRIMNQLKAGKKIEHYETQRKAKNGRIINVSLTVSPIRDSQGNLIGASKIARDISDRKENERRRDEFISTVSHELKTPISSQKIYVELLAEQIEKDGAEQYKKLITKINQQTLKLEKLVSDLLELSRIHVGRIKMNNVQFDLSRLIAEMVEDMQKTTTHKIINHVVKPMNVRADRDRIGQVLVNLLSNGIKYSPDADKVEISAELVGEEVVVSVRDFGIGISPEFKEKIFERFFRINGEDETTYPGMGIGLNFSSEIINLHGGRIWVESEAGKGSTFSFNLPNVSPKKAGRGIDT